MTYAEIRQHILVQLSPEMDPAEIPALLHTVAFIALHGDAMQAAAALLGRGRPDLLERTRVERLMEQVEDSWAEEIAALRAEVIRQHGLSVKTRAGAEAVLALLQREFIQAPTP
jgi:hypothetical protein